MEGIRKGKRFPCMGSADIRANSLKPESRVTIVTLYNISVSGIMCAPGINVETGTPLDIYIYEFMENPVDIRLSGKVAWLADGISDYMGISFDEEITEEIHPMLYKIIWGTCNERDETENKRARSQVSGVGGLN